VASTANAAAAAAPPARKGPRIYSREAVLVGCCATLLLLVAFTAAINRIYHRKIHTLADSWAAQGDAAAAAGDLQQAIADYRNSLVFSPNNTLYQFRLAQTLASTNKNDNEAQNYLINLYTESPGSGPINLELARVASHRKDGYSDALRYYHSAIDGEWSGNPVGRRWDVRRELCGYLLQNGRIEQARVEVMALADNTPLDEGEQQLAVGQLLLKTQEWNRALDLFKPMTTATTGGGQPNQAALVGAGTAAFNLGEYVTARDYYLRLPPERRSQADVTSMLAIAHEVMAADPYLSGLSVKDRALRASNAVGAATQRAQTCIASNPPSTPNGPVARAVAQLRLNAYQFDRMQTDWNERNLASFPDRLEDAMSLAFATEGAAAMACGEPQGKDRPLWLLSRARMGQAN
jgi:tetratricopeptide (TPR) repeat protein